MERPQAALAAGLMRGYAICAEPRSGSSFLGYVLASTEVLGRPLEYFNAPAMRKIAGFGDYPEEPERQLEAVIARGATANGVYGVKVFGNHRERMQAAGWTQRLPGLSFVRLERRDRLGQAISLVRALQTGRWTAHEEPLAEAAYDRAAIDRTLRYLDEAEARWSSYFACNDTPVLHLIYEDVAAAPQSAAEAVARLVGLAGPAQVDERRLKDAVIQRDALSEAWRARFTAEMQERAAFEEGDRSAIGPRPETSARR
jgi:LPS sulfotransferase NodH